jgi:protein-tyrosine phosphatase
MQALSKLPPEVLQIIMGSDPEVMRRALATIDTRYGGPIALAKTRFGLTDEKVAKLRANYLA